MRKIIYIFISSFIFLSCILDKHEEPAYSLTYYGNGNTHGDVPVDLTKYSKDDHVEILNVGTLKKTNYIFSHWNTKPDGTGKKYKGRGHKTSIQESLHLFAIWEGLTDGIIINDYNEIVDYSGASTEVYIPKADHRGNNRYIKPMAFYNSNLTSFKGENLYWIETYAFMDSKNLKNVIIDFDTDNKYENIMSDSFYGCINLETMDLANAYTEKSYFSTGIFNELKNLKSVIFRGNKSTLDDFSFKDCKNLETVFFLSDSLILESSVFDGCDKLTTITLPKKIYIKEDSFSKSNIKELTLTSYPSYMFDGIELDIPKIEKIIVPNNLVDTYKDHKQWGKFADIIEAGDHEYEW